MSKNIKPAFTHAFVLIIFLTGLVIPNIIIFNSMGLLLFALKLALYLPILFC